MPLDTHPQHNDRAVRPAALPSSKPNPGTLTAYWVRIFAVVSWGCAATHWLARTLNAHPDIVCFHHGKSFWQLPEGTVVENDIEQLRIFQAIGHSLSCTAAGDVHGTALQSIEPAREKFKDMFRCAIVTREPIARLRSALALFKIGPPAGTWEAEFVQCYIDQGVRLPEDTFDARLVLYAIHMLNRIERESQIAPIWRVEDLTQDPEALVRFVDELTGGSVETDLDWARMAVALPRTSQHAKSQQEFEDWQIDAIRKIVTPEAWDMYARYGYERPGFL